MRIVVVLASTVQSGMPTCRSACLLALLPACVHTCSPACVGAFVSAVNALWTPPVLFFFGGAGKKRVRGERRIFSLTCGSAESHFDGRAHEDRKSVV